MRRHRPHVLLLFAAALLLLATTAAADWLVTRGGAEIETRGAWSVEGEKVVYTTTAGREASLDLANVDLEASEELTVKSRLVIYRTEWCGYCQRAEKLLDSLDVPYLVKDIEKDRAAGVEFRQRFGSSGIPVLDVDGQIIRGYSEAAIRGAVEQLKEKYEDEAAGR